MNTLKHNTVILNNFIAGIYNDDELDGMLDKLADYYGVNRNDFIVTQDNPWDIKLI